MSARRGRRAHLGSTHPLARVARHRCDDLHGWAGQALIGGVACGACWEHAIRADERVVVEHGLPPEPTYDPSLIDEVAVERAVRGQRVRLTRAERAAVVSRLAGGGLRVTQIAYRMRTSRQAVCMLLADVEPGTVTRSAPSPSATKQAYRQRDREFERSDA